MKKVLVTPRSFGKLDEEPINRLETAGIEVVKNPYGRILTKKEMLHLVEDIDGIIIGVDPIDRDVIDRAKKLKIISKYGVGTDNIDISYAREQKISVTTTSGANTDAVAEYTIGLMLSVARKIVNIDNECRKLNWGKIITNDMNKKTLGLIGMGQIGKTVVKLLSGFQMNVIAYDIFEDEKFAKEFNVRYVDSINEVLKEADFISLHLPLNQETHNIIREEQFDMMKESAVLVNTARGGLIDEDSLLDALEKNKILGAGIDVFEEEPPKNKKILNKSNLVIGSHCAASTKQSIVNMGRLATKNLIDFFAN